jgi:hypothetical protein
MLLMQDWMERDVRKGKTLNADGAGSCTDGKAVYEAPSIEKLGFFHVETRVCLWGKQWGGYDSFAGIVNVPISNCSA